MSKKYDDVKRAAEAALKGLMRTIYSNLDDKEADNLILELSMSMFTATINFDLPFNEFQKEVNNKNVEYQLTMLEQIVRAKKEIDEGNNDFKTI